MGIKKQKIKIKKIIPIIAASAIIIVVIVCLVIKFNPNNEPATRDYGYAKNLNVDGIALGNFHDGMAKIANSEGKIGFIDKRGDIAIYPQFYTALDFDGGLTCVNKLDGDNFSFAIINKSGKNVTNWANGLCGDNKDGLFQIYDLDAQDVFVIDKNGNRQTQQGTEETEETEDNTKKYSQYTRVDKFSNGLAYAETLSEAGFIKENGNWAFKIDGYAAGKFHNNRAVLAKPKTENYEQYVVDKTGKTIFSLSKYNNKYDFSSLENSYLPYYTIPCGREYSEGLLLVCNYKDNHNNFYLLDDQGDVVFSLKSK